MAHLWTKKFKLFLLLSLTNGVLGQLENEDFTLGVYLDNSRVMGFKEKTEQLVMDVAKTASAAMQRGSLTIKFLQNLSQIGSSDLFGSIVVSQCEKLQEIQKFPGAESDQKLLIAITDAGCNRLDRVSTLTIPLVRSNNDVVQLISDLRTKNTIIWEDIVVILDGSIEYENDIIEVLRRPTKTSKQTSVLVMDISKFASVSDGLRSIFNKLTPRVDGPAKRQFIAIVSQKNVPILQKSSKMNNLNGVNYQWLFVIADTQSLNYDMTIYLDNIIDGDNVAFAYNMSVQNPASSCNLGYDCVLEEMITSVASKLSNGTLEEIKLYSEVSEEEWQYYKPSQADRAFTVITDIQREQYNAPGCMSCIRWGIQAVEIKGPQRFDLIDVADWTPSGGLMLMDDIFPHVTGGFRGRVIRVASLDYPPFQIFNVGPQGTSYGGLIFNIMDRLGTKLNFTYAVVTPPDKSWGNKNDAGEWDGMIKMVQDKEVLMSAAAFTVTSERMSVVNFSATIDLEPYTYLMARPQELSRVMIFIEPFANETWVWIGVMVALMGPILYVIHGASPYYDFHGTRHKRGLFNLQNCSWYTYGAILQQGGNILPDAHSGRTLVAFWWIFVTVVVTTYSGNLVAFLTFPKLEIKVSTLQDLLDSGTMTWGYSKGNVLTEYFKNAEGMFKEIGEEAELHNGISNEVLEAVRNKDHAYIEWKTNLLYIIKTEYDKTQFCDYSLSTEDFFYEKVAFIFPKDNPYIATFDKEIKRLRETGLLEKFKLDNWPDTNKCSAQAIAAAVTMRTVSMSDMQGSFFILMIGFLIALGIIIVEGVVKFIWGRSGNSAASTRTVVKSLMA